MYNDEELVNKCLQKDPRAQEFLYRKFASRMYGVALRYAKDTMDADDILQDAFIKVFFNLSAFRAEGSLEGWIRRTVVNTAINHYRAGMKFQHDINVDGHEISLDDDVRIISELSNQDLIKTIQMLPEGYRMVFNLNVIEGYNHQEIGTLLNISENTSKSQLSRARKALIEMIKRNK